MPALTVSKLYVDGNILTEAMLDAIKSSLETFFNTTKIDSTNIQNGGVALVNLASTVQAALWQVGDMKTRGSTTVQTGWLAANGQAVSRTTYAALFAEIGTTWDTFNGAGAPAGTDFRVPNMSGVAPIGDGTGNGLTARTLGAFVGAETHTLSAAESGTPGFSHTVNDSGHGHAITDPGHFHTTALNDNDGGTATYSVDLQTPADADAGTTYNVFDSGSAGTSITVNTETTGITVSAHAAAAASSAHNNMPPSAVVKWVIKT